MCVCVCCVFVLFSFLSGNKVEFQFNCVWYMPRNLYKFPGTNADSREVCRIKCQLPSKMPIAEF